MATPRAWSYSRLLDYEKCPQLYKFKAIDKLPEPANKAMERGTTIHKLAETALLKPKTKVPPELLRVADTIKLLRGLKAGAEVQTTLRHQFEGSTGWFSKDAWCRVKIDAKAVVTYEDALMRVAPTEVADGKRGQLHKLDLGSWVVDWKTGQYRPEAGQDQLELYAFSEFLLEPKLEFVVASLIFIDLGRAVHAYYDNRQLVTPLKKKWLRRVAKLQADTKFTPRPGAACTWCFFSKTKGGPCPAA